MPRPIMGGIPGGGMPPNISHTQGGEKQEKTIRIILGFRFLVNGFLPGGGPGLWRPAGGRLYVCGAAATRMTT